MDRRKKLDFWARLLLWLNIISWIMLISILLVFHRAQPEFETFFDRFYQLSLRTEWDYRFVYYLIRLVLLGVFVSLAGLVLGIFRGRRKQDHKKVLAITGIISVILLMFAVFLI